VTTNLPHRYITLAMLFAVSVASFADRTSLSITGAAVSADLNLSPVMLGYLFSAFGWAYVAAQIPSGALLDRFGSKKVYGIALLAWGVLSFLQGFVGSLPAAVGVAVLFSLRFLLGLAASPVFPGNARIVSAWFPNAERGVATAVFASAQYFSLVVFYPLIGWVTHSFGWRWVFFLTGIIGIGLAGAWPRVIYGPMDHPRMTTAERDRIERGGALVWMDQPRASSHPSAPAGWRYVKRLLQSRMMVGIYVGQAFLTTVTWFFLTWFPLYLVEAKGLPVLKAGFVATIPAVFGFFGAMAGGGFSDHLLRRGYSLSRARKTPIVLGMLLSTTIIGCVYVRDAWPVIALMSLAVFGRGFATMGWTVIADVAPREAAGLSGGLFNTFSNLSGIITPIAIGYIVQRTGSYDGALVFIGATALLAISSFVFVAGKLERLEFDESGWKAVPAQGAG
jgi:ACS family glucarate transporter-like MFS transporter